MCSINIVESVEDAGQTLAVNELREIRSKQEFFDREVEKICH